MFHGAQSFPKPGVARDNMELPILRQRELRVSLDELIADISNTSTSTEDCLRLFSLLNKKLIRSAHLPDFSSLITAAQGAQCAAVTVRVAVIT